MLALASFLHFRPILVAFVILLLTASNSWAQHSAVQAQNLIESLDDKLPPHVKARLAIGDLNARIDGIHIPDHRSTARQRAFVDRLENRLAHERFTRPASVGAQVSANEDDSLALVDLYNSTGGNLFWVDKGGWLSDPVADWKGVTLNDDGRVIELDLNNNLLLGVLPATLANLSELQVLNLSNNLIRENIIPELGQLANLEVLNLSQNILSGVIPPELGDLSNLKGLFLWLNRLEGSIPVELANLTQLEDLWLFANTLTGEIPEELGNLSNLLGLALDLNLLTGKIPIELGQLGNLLELSLDNNMLTGGIPPELAGLQNLQSLFLGGNDLGGEVPIDLSVIPTLSALSIPEAGLTGSIPDNINAFRFLSFLDLSDNELTGAIPESINGLINLTTLNLASNQLTGNISPNHGLFLHGLSALNLSGNQLTGDIPANLASIIVLRELDLSNNQLSGPIPNFFTTEGMRWLYLDDNQLAGHLTDQLHRLTRLIELDLSGNNLTGPLPASLGDLQALERAIFSRNNFSGTIPAVFQDMPALLILGLFDNRFSGQIPLELAESEGMVLLDLGQNEFSGPIPAAFGEMPALQAFYVDKNQLSGPLPATFAGNQQLLALRLEHNNLTALPDLSGGTNLIQLRIELNQFTFEDLEPLIPLNILSVTYAPQQPIYPIIDDLGDDTRYNAEVGGSANQYTWNRNDVTIAGEASPVLLLNDAANASNSDSIKVEVTSRLVPGLVLESPPIRTDAVLASIAITPDPIALAPGDSLQLMAAGTDQFGQMRRFTTEWTATGGSIDSLGLFIAGEVEGTYETTVTNYSGSVSQTAAVLIDSDIGPTNAEMEQPTVAKHTLASNFPNPFTASSQINFTLAETASVTLRVFDVLGREMAVLLDQVLPAGGHTALLEASSWPAGVYFYQLEAGETVQTRPMIKR